MIKSIIRALFSGVLFIFLLLLLSEEARNDYKQRGLKPFIYMFLVYVAVYIFIGLSINVFCK
ncbi:hypothetical protein TKV_c23270 [Thermoanaerobacter kivui]|uniref:Uncharacterized protein n=1 Tax=Thermoanaerobacter kivui TaxID=2325 RepID=A0A097AUH5_THEKI|nr:hypothetical protein [Thermoanaerobacter kivui]AIS53453.1 hypothetical protein TKV_c23270 [Thermoanaerobacter kivui]